MDCLDEKPTLLLESQDRIVVETGEGWRKIAAQAGMQAHKMPTFISTILLVLSFEPKQIKDGTHVVKTIRGDQ